MFRSRGESTHFLKTQKHDTMSDLERLIENG